MSDALLAAEDLSFSYRSGEPILSRWSAEFHTAETVARVALDLVTGLVRPVDRVDPEREDPDDDHEGDATRVPNRTCCCCC